MREFTAVHLGQSRPAPGGRQLPGQAVISAVARPLRRVIFVSCAKITYCVIIIIILFIESCHTTRNKNNNNYVGVQSDLSQTWLPVLKRRNTWALPTRIFSSPEHSSRISLCIQFKCSLITYHQGDIYLSLIHI